MAAPGIQLRSNPVNHNNWSLLFSEILDKIHENIQNIPLFSQSNKDFIKIDELFLETIETEGRTKCI